MDITRNVIETASAQGKVLMSNYRADLDRAYLNADGDFSVAVTHKFSPKGSGVSVESSINFVAERIKDKTTSVVDDKQMKLDLDGPHPPDCAEWCPTNGFPAFCDSEHACPMVSCVPFRKTSVVDLTTIIEWKSYHTPVKTGKPKKARKAA